MDRGFTIADFGSFEKLIAPKLLRIVYWLGVAGIVIFALISMVGALGTMQYSVAMGLGTLIIAAIGLLFGLLFWRVIIEMYMVFFGIYERLGDIRRSLDKPDI